MTKEERDFVDSLLADAYSHIEYIEEMAPQWIEDSDVDDRTVEPKALLDAAKVDRQRCEKLVECIGGNDAVGAACYAALLQQRICLMYMAESNLRSIVQATYKQRDKRFRNRDAAAQTDKQRAVELHQAGRSNKDIAKALRVHRNTVSKWLKKK